MTSTSAEGLGEREIGRTKTNLQIFFKEVTQEIVQRSLQIGKADVGINDQAFHLMEHWGVGLIVVVTIHAAGAIMRIGGCWLAMVRICTPEVCVRRRRVASNQKVSWSARAGWWP